jgi:hypothetical protein
MGIGTKTAFSGLGKTPTGELRDVSGQTAALRWPKGRLPDICLDAGLLAQFSTSVQSDMDRGIRRGLLRVEILNQSRIRVQIRPR